MRTKRGLINGLGSIFKSISGNLDYADGERYDKLIQELQNNQINLVNNIKNQNTHLLTNLTIQFNRLDIMKSYWKIEYTKFLIL